jgi:hypothetical protein
MKTTKQLNEAMLKYSSFVRKREYCPYLSRVLNKNLLAATLLQRMLINAQRSTFKLDREGAFFKFIRPNGHTLYKVGDSWVEELGTTYRKFQTARDLFATKAETREEIDTLLRSRKKTCAVVYFKGADNLTRWYLNMKVIYGLLEEAKVLFEEEQELREKQDNYKKEKKLRDTVIETLSAENITLPASSKMLSPETLDNSINTIILGLEDFSETDEEEEITPDVEERFRKFQAQEDKKENKKKSKKSEPKVEEIVEKTPEQLAEEKAVKDKNLTKQKYLLERKLGKVMPEGFKINQEAIELALSLGYNEEDVRYNAIKFERYYSIGNGVDRVSTDWNNKFVMDWLDRAWTRGTLKRNGKLFNEKQSRSEQIRKLVNTDRYSEFEGQN